MTITVNYAWSYPAVGGTGFTINTLTTGTQGSLAVTKSGSGFVAAWFNGATNGDVSGRFYSDVITPYTNELTLNSTTTNTQTSPAAATLTNGNIVFAFTDTSANANGDILVRLFSSSAVPIGTDRAVSSLSGTYPNSNPDVAALADGGFVVTWTRVFSGPDYDLRALVFNADGSVRGSLITIDATNANAQNSSVAGLANGNFVVTWEETPSGGGSPIIRMKIVAANGSQVLATTTIDATGSIQTDTQVLALKDGGFAVAYTDNGWGVDGTEITLKIFNADGSQRTGFILANVTTTSDQNNPSLTQMDNGFIVVGWNNGSSGYERAFDPTTGAAAGGEFLYAGSVVQGETIALSGGVVENPRTSTFNDTGDIRSSASELIRYSTGDGANDVFVSDNLRDVINGGAGVDTVVYSGAASQYTRVRNADGSLTITDLRSGSPNGIDLLTNVEKLQFTDRTLDMSHKILGDIDFDGVSDILFRNINGTVASWLTVVGGGAGQAGYTSFGGVSSDWKIQDVGDFDGDGHADILWRNDSGEIGAWLSSKGANNANYTYMGAAGPEWQIQSVGDFDGDGKADIVFRRSDGDVGFWNSTKGFGGAGFTDVGLVPAVWKIQGSGDFDGDGKADVLWRNDNGEVGAWLSSHGAANANYTTMGAVGSDWKIVTVADFDGDGQADILFMRNTTQMAFWLSSKGFGGAGFTDLGLVGSGWSVVGSGDYDGDGKADILFRNTNSGEMGAWESSHGMGSASYVSFGVVPLDWQAYAPH